MRGDARQGTIDQDQEFIDFLQSLTEPATKTSTQTDAQDTESKGKVKITPLIQYLKDKKANKIKEAAAAKAAKNQPKADPKGGKIEKAESKKVTLIKKDAQSPGSKSKQDRDQENTKGKPAVPKSKIDTPTPPSPSAAKSPKRERERGSISAAAKILQRDLGLTSAKSERRVSRSAVARGATQKPESAQPTPEATTTSAAPVVSPTAISSSPATPIRPPTGPRNTKHPTPAQVPSGPTAVVPARTPRPVPLPSPGARSAFLKHANFSQGVTEDLLQAAFSAFGPISRCEIDKKKGFGYVDFDEPEGLKAAMLASPVRVGDKGGQVVVLENRNVKAKLTPVAASTPTVQIGETTPSQPATKIEGVTSLLATETPTAPTPPTAPRGALTPRGRGQHPRANFGQSRGFIRGGRGRAGFRGRGGIQQNTNVQSGPKEASAAPAPVGPPT